MPITRRRGVRAAFAAASLAACAAPGTVAQPADEPLVFSTYLGGSAWEHARDVCTDRDGNVVVVGGTASPDFPTTPGALDRTFASGGDGTGDAGDCDAFVAKFSPDGRLLWSTLLGGPGYDRAYAVEVDARGSVYVCGRAGPGFPVTQGAFQTEHLGSRVGLYGVQCAFAAKLAPDGASLAWASYLGTAAASRDLAIDADGDVYLNLAWETEAPRTPAWFATAFAGAAQPQRRGGRESGVAKVSSDGTRVLWATWLGGSGDEVNASIRVDADERVYVAIDTTSTDLAAPSAGPGSAHAGGRDGYVALLKADGSRQRFGVYVGGSADDWLLNTHPLAIDAAGNAYVLAATASPDFPTTPGALDRTMDGPGDMAVAKVSAEGRLVAGTFLGGSAQENPDGVEVGPDGAVFLAGETTSPDFPVTADALQPRLGGRTDAVAVVLAPDLSRIEYATFLGGPATDKGRAACVGRDGSLHVVGAASGPGWPVRRAHQPEFGGGGRPDADNDAVVARIRRPAR